MRRTLLGLLGVLLVTPSLAPSAAHAAAAKLTPQITLTPASELTYEHQSTTVTGTVVTAAGDGTRTPLAGQVVKITCDRVCTDGEVTTDDAGRFTVPVTAKGDNTSVTASIDGTDTLEAASRSWWFSPQSDSRITGLAGPDVVTPESPTTTISGKLEYRGDDSVWKPLPGRTVLLKGIGVDTSAVVGADGSFSTTVTPAPTQATDSIRVWWSPAEHDEVFFDYTAAYVRVYSPSTLTISGFHAHVDTEGMMDVGADIDGADTDVPVRVQYSTDRTTWTTVTQPTVSRNFSTTFRARAVPAYYRLDIPAGKSYHAATSDVVKVNRIVTSISGFKASVDASASLLIKGKLRVSGSNGTVPVRIEYSGNGKSGWRTLDTLVEQNGSSFVKAYDAPLATAYYRARVIPTMQYAGATSSQVKSGRTITRVTGVKFSSKKVRKGSSFTISGRLQKYSGGKWKPLSRQRVWMVFRLRGSSELYWYSKPVTNSSGRFSARIKPPGSARWIPVFYAPAGYYSSAPKAFTLVTVK